MINMNNKTHEYTIIVISRYCLRRRKYNVGVSSINASGILKAWLSIFQDFRISFYLFSHNLQVSHSPPKKWAYFKNVHKSPSQSIRYSGPKQQYLTHKYFMRYTFNSIDIQLPHSPTFTSKHQFTIDYRFDTSGKENGKFEKKKKKEKKETWHYHSC